MPARRRSAPERARRRHMARVLRSGAHVMRSGGSPTGCRFRAACTRTHRCREGRACRSAEGVLPLSDGIPARRFPIVNVSLIVANFAVWIFYELPHLNSSILHASFYPCTVNNSCHGPEPWGVSWITSMFLHGSWDHILGNMLFLADLRQERRGRASARPLSRLLLRRRIRRDDRRRPR